MFKHTTVIRSEVVDTWYGKLTQEHTITYKLSPNPFKLLSRWDLPKSHELESYESSEDLWFRKHRVLYNLKEFCTIGMSHLPGPYGGAQLASNGYFAIAAYMGEVHGVSMEECKPISW